MSNVTAATGRRPPRLPRAWPVGVVIAALLLCAPWAYFATDMAALLRWGRASQGTAPWHIYLAMPDCNYPPFVLLLLTLAEAARRALGAAPAGPAAVTLVKLPGLLACAGGVPLCRYGLGPVAGPARARAAAWAYGLCLPLWLNAALWGQSDALLSLAMVAAVVALLRGRPGWCGALVGVALSIKLQAVVLVPALAVFLLRRHGPRALAAGGAAAAAAWAAVALPFFAGGAGGGVLGAYAGASGYYDRCAAGAMNGWYLLDHFEAGARGLPRDSWVPDERLFLHTVSYKSLGLLLFGASLLFLLAGLWRRPTRYVLVLTGALAVFAFFMLPTEMHERYVVPAVALLALIAPARPSARRLFNLLSVMAVLDQLFQLVLNRGRGQDAAMHAIVWMTRNAALDDVGAAVNLGLLLWAARLFWREVFAAPGARGGRVL